MSSFGLFTPPKVNKKIKGVKFLCLNLHVEEKTKENPKVEMLKFELRQDPYHQEHP